MTRISISLDFEIIVYFACLTSILTIKLSNNKDFKFRFFELLFIEMTKWTLVVSVKCSILMDQLRNKRSLPEEYRTLIEIKSIGDHSVSRARRFHRKSIRQCTSRRIDYCLISPKRI